MPTLGPAEIIVILVVALLVFGPNKMPEIARQLGRGVREFRRVQQHLRSELRDVVSEFDSPSSSSESEFGSDPVPMLPPKNDVTPPSPAAPAGPQAAAPDAEAPTSPAPPSSAAPPTDPPAEPA